MEIGKIGHASLVVTSSDVRCLVDPVFFDPFEAGSNTFFPAVAIAPEELARDADLIVLSHAHMDHFSVPTLAMLPRSCAVLYPEGSAIIASALKRLGYDDVHPVAPIGTNQEIVEAQFGDLRIVPTPSNVGFPEMGIRFRTDTESFWNQVDTIVDERIVALVLARVGAIDVLGATFQPLVETFADESQGAPFPVSRYSSLLRNVAATGPAAVFPASSGLAYAAHEWMNARGFPMTERRFLEDVRRIAPGTQTRYLDPGAAISCAAPYEVKSNAVSGVRLLQRGATGPSVEWRPDRGVPPLIDDNRLGYSSESLRKQVRSYFEDTFTAQANHSANRQWRRRLSRVHAHWRIEVVFPDRSATVWWYVFRDGLVEHASPASDTFADGHTSVTASLIAGVLDGALGFYPACIGMGGRRVHARLYEVTESGIVSAGSANDDPLLRTLLRDADERFVDRELTRLGF